MNDDEKTVMVLTEDLLRQMLRNDIVFLTHLLSDRSDRQWITEHINDTIALLEKME